MEIEMVILNTKEGDPTERVGAVNDKDELLGEIDFIGDENGARITYLYVREEYRRMGIASELLQFVVERLDETGLFIPLEFTFPVDEENAWLQDFMNNQFNFDLAYSSNLFMIEPDLWKKSDRIKSFAKKDTDAKPFFSIDEKARKEFFADMEAKEYDMLVKNDKSMYDPGLCFGRVVKGKIQGAIFGKVYDKKNIEISFMVTRDDSPKTFMSLLSAFIQAAEENYKNANVWICAITPETYGEIDGVFGKKLKPIRMCTAIWDGTTREDLFGIAEIINEG